MKKFFIAGLVSLMLTPAFAQFGDGNILLGGSFCIESDGSKNDDGTNVTKNDKDFAFEIGPQVHYMLSDRISVGGRFFYRTESTTSFLYLDPTDPEEETKEKDKSSTVGLSPLFRYWWPIGEKKKFGMFAEAGVGFSTTGGKDEEYDPFEDEVMSTDLDRTNSMSLFAYPGIFYAPAECFFFEVKFGGFGLWYFYDVTKDQDSDAKFKDGYLKVGGDLNELFFTNTYVGFNFVF